MSSSIAATRGEIISSSVPIDKGRGRFWGRRQQLPRNIGGWLLQRLSQRVPD